MITAEFRELIEDMVRRIARLEARSSLPNGWRFEDRDAGVWGPSGLYCVGPNGTATHMGAR